MQQKPLHFPFSSYFLSLDSKAEALAQASIAAVAF